MFCTSSQNVNDNSNLVVVNFGQPESYTAASTKFFYI